MYGDVNATVEDGNLGLSMDTGTGVHVKIGISSVETNVPILITGTMKPEKIKEKLGLSPLADACMDSIENGAGTIYCIPINEFISGSFEELKKDGNGKGTVSFQGKPNNSYDIRLFIIEAGRLNQATMKYSLDGGYTYSEEFTIPMDGSYEIPNTGVTMLFQEAGLEEEKMQSFLAQDCYSIHTNAPTMSNEVVLKAVDTLKSNTTQYEYVHIVGESGKTLWAALTAKAEEFLMVQKKPLFFICEGRYKREDETVDAYVTAMIQERKGIQSKYLQVVLSYSYYIRMDGREQRINNAGIVCGLYSLASESQSIGETKSFSISEAKMEHLLPVGIEDYIFQLDKEKYLTFRQYEGLEGFYVTSANVMSPENSDYRYAEDVRVSNRLIKAVRNKALYELQVQIDPSELEVSLKNIEEQLNIPIEKARDDKIISHGEVKIEANQTDILVSEQINITISYVPFGHLRTINLSFAMENPYRS